MANGVVSLQGQVYIHQHKVDIDADINVRIPEKQQVIRKAEDPIRTHQKVVLVESRKNAILKVRASQDMPNRIRVR